MSPAAAAASAMMLAVASLLLGCGPEGDPAEAVFPAAPLSIVTSDSGALRIEVRTAPDQPPTVGVSSVELRIRDAGTAQPRAGLDITAQTWMPSHGHGASAQPEVTTTGGGVYLVERVSFFMPGAWELVLTIGGEASDAAKAAFDVQ